MPTINTSPPSPAYEGIEGILVSCTVEQTVERVQFDIDALIGTPLRNESWKLYSLPTSQIKLYEFFWEQIQSSPGIYVIRISNDGTYYEVAVHTSYIPWLLSHKFDLDLSYDPTKPADADVRIHGAWAAKGRAEAQFIDSAVKAIRSGLRGLRLCFFEIALLRGLRIPLEWALLNNDIVESGPQVRRKFTQCLVFLGMNLIQTYDTPPALKLLSKDQDELLEVFTDLSKTGKGDRSCDELQAISLFRCLLEYSGGREDFSQHTLNRERTANENANLCGALIGITGSECFGDFNTQKMLNALSGSKVFLDDDDVHTIDVEELSTQMMTFLCIGYPKGHLDLPAEVLYRLGTGHVDEICIQITHFYHKQPSLCIPQNNVLLLLTWSSVAIGDPLRVLSEWVASDDGLSLYRRLTRDIQTSQGMEQLVLILAALLSHKRLLPYTPNDTTQPIKGSYLADFDALIKGETLSNMRSVFERMLFSFLRVLETERENHDHIRQFLVTVLDAATPVLDRLDGLTDEYLVQRMTGMTHEKALTKIYCQVDDWYIVEEEWMMVESLKL